MKDSKKNPPTSNQPKPQVKSSGVHTEQSMAEKLETRKILSREGK
jgi:hypothetical protein